MAPAEQIVHASTVAMAGRAVMLKGASGSGKSSLALQLIGQGAVLVADDRTRLWRAGDTLMADAPPAIRGRIEARGLGLLNAPAAGPRPVALVVDLDRTETARLPPFRSITLLGLPVPVIAKIDAAHLPAAIALYLEHGRNA